MEINLSICSIHRCPWRIGYLAYCIEIKISFFIYWFKLSVEFDLSEFDLGFGCAYVLEFWVFKGGIHFETDKKRKKVNFWFSMNSYWSESQISVLFLYFISLWIYVQLWIKVGALLCFIIQFSNGFPQNLFSSQVFRTFFGYQDRGFTKKC